MRAAASSLNKLAKLRTPAAQVGVMLLPPVYTLDEWEALVIAHLSALMAACAQDRGEDGEKPPNLPDPMTRAAKSPSR